MKGNDKRRNLGRSEKKKEHGKTKIWVKTIDFLFPLQFSKLYMMFETKIITLSDVALSVCRGNKRATTMRSSNYAPGIYLKQMKTYVHTKTCTQMFIATLFIVAKNWKQHIHPSAGEWFNNCGTLILWIISQQ